MKSIFRSALILWAAILIGMLSFAKVKTNHSLIKSKKEIKMDTIAKQIFIDKFLVPEKAIQEFKEKSKINMSFITKQPGFIKDEAFECMDEKGNLIYITIVTWKDGDAIKKAKAAVQAEYRRQGFNPLEMMERLNIALDRGIYKKVEDQAGMAR